MVLNLHKKLYNSVQQSFMSFLLFWIFCLTAYPSSIVFSTHHFYNLSILHMRTWQLLQNLGNLEK